jgi:hypothetical protein
MDEALADFQRVPMLDSTHAEAQWAVQELELLTERAPEPGDVRTGQGACRKAACRRPAREKNGGLRTGVALK